MRMKHFIFAILTVLIVFFAGMHVGKGEIGPRMEVVTETIVDTITYYVPTPEATTSLGVQSYVLPKYVFIGGGLARQCETDSVERGCAAEEASGCGNDSAIAELPMVQRYYADSAFEAWVSGPIDPRLDSVRVQRPTTMIGRWEMKPRTRWHIGPSIGCGYSPEGFQPYIGVSLTYSIISW